MDIDYVPKRKEKSEPKTSKKKSKFLHFEEEEDDDDKIGFTLSHSKIVKNKYMESD